MSVAEGRRKALREFVLVAVLYLAYDVSRALADHNLAAAVGRATRISRIEDGLGIAWEGAFNRVFVDHSWIGLLADYWYSTAHYVGTVTVLVWLFRRSQGVYVRARRALALGTIIGLACYLLLPTAPPRMLAGYVDVLSVHSGAGWWGSDASAPKGLGGMTNELAAFPSLHAGWSLWVALAITSATYSKVLRTLGWTYAATTAVVVIGTANHWVIDVLVGWAVIGVAWFATSSAMRSILDWLLGVFAESVTPWRPDVVAASMAAATTEPKLGEAQPH